MYHCNKTPIQIYHGDKDESVSLECSQKTEKLLKEEGKTLELIMLSGQPHEFIPPSWTHFMQGSAAFFKTQL